MKMMLGVCLDSSLQMCVHVRLMFTSWILHNVQFTFNKVMDFQNKSIIVLAAEQVFGLWLYNWGSAWKKTHILSIHSPFYKAVWKWMKLEWVKIKHALAKIQFQVNRMYGFQTLTQAIIVSFGIKWIPQVIYSCPSCPNCNENFFQHVIFLFIF